MQSARFRNPGVNLQPVVSLGSVGSRLIGAVNKVKLGGGYDVPAAISAAYRRHLGGGRTEASLLATGSYFVTLVLVRLYTNLVPAADIAVGGTHIHHVVFGIVALLVAGFLSLDEVHRLLRALLFGIGAALVLDEIALVVFLKDVYWLPQGSLSVFALVVGLIALAVNAWRSAAFIRDIATALRHPK